MRNTKEVVLGETRITIKELTIKEIRTTIEEIQNKPMLEAVDTILHKIAGIPFKDVENFTASEIKQFFQEVKNVNAPFFEIPDLLRYLGLGEAWEQTKKKIMEPLQLAMSQVETKPAEQATQPSSQVI